MHDARLGLVLEVDVLTSSPSLERTSNVFSGRLLGEQVCFKGM